MSDYENLCIVEKIRKLSLCPEAEDRRAIGEVNRFYENSKKKMILITPGRIGTSSPELGVPITYAEMSRFSEKSLDR